MSVAHEIQKQLHQIAKDQGIAYQLILMNYMQDQFLYRISQSSCKSHFILKGGVIMRVIIDTLARPTADIDFLLKDIQNDASIILDYLKEIINIEINDGLRFDHSTLHIELNQDNLIYMGFRADVICYLGLAWQKIWMDLGFSDIVIPEAELILFPLILSKEKLSIFAYNIETIIAEKIDTIFDKGITNTRMKDFYDLYMILTSKNVNGSNFIKVLMGVMNKDWIALVSF